MSKAQKKQKSVKGRKPQATEEKAKPWLPWALAAGIVLLTFITLSPTLENDWTNWDDEVYVLDNSLIAELNGETVAQLFDPETRTLANYDPVSMLTLAFDYQSAKSPDGEGGIKLEAKPFHRTSLLFHLFNTFLVFLWLWQIGDRKLLLPILGALFFGIHPMHVEAVAWVSARKEVVFAFFFLLSLIAYTRYLKKENWLFFGLAFLAFVLSALSKPTAVTLPLVLLALDYFKDKKWNVRGLLEKVPFLAVSIWIGILTIQGQADANALEGNEVVSLGMRILVGCYGFIIYLVKAIFPFGMSALHPYPEEISAYFYLAPLAVLGALAGLFFLWKKQRKGMVFAGLFYLFTVVLVLQFVSFGHTLFAERFTYVPYIGVFLLIGFGIKWAFEKYPENSAMKWGIYTVLGMMTVIFIPTSQQQVRVWKDSGNLWDQAIERYPDRAALAYNNRGLWHKNRGQYSQALNDFNSALSLDNQKYLYYNNRGNLYRELAEAGQSEQDYLQRSIADHSRAVELNTEDADGYNSRGLTYLDLGNEKSALGDFSKSLSLDPDNDVAYLNRGVLYLNSQQLEPALLDFDKYLSTNPSDLQITNLRGYTRFRLGKFDQALQDQNLVLQGDPQNGSYYMFRAFTLDTLGRVEDALRDAQKAQELGAQLEAGFIEKLEAKLAE